MQIGNYRITGELARGGMGVVYLGQHVTLPREVVVKCIRLLSLGDAEQNELRARFLREAHIQSQLDHPHIVRVYEFLIEREDHYLVMEYVRGQSLRSLLDRERVLRPDRVVALAAQALEALAHAHGLRFVDESGMRGIGVIHRDIKPANLLIDEQGNLKLTDFGIAKVVDSKLTRAGFVCGTIDYMSPEQINDSLLDGRSDLYSLGLAIYEALCGRLPFARQSNTSDYEVLRHHLEVDPPPVSAINPNVPATLAAVVGRSLQKDPGKRWQTAAEFREALLSHDSAVHPITVPDAAAPPARPATQRPRWIKAGAAAAALIVVAALAGSYWLKRTGDAARPAPLQPSVAVLPFADMSPAKDQEYFADGLADELLNALAKIPGLQVAGRTSSFQFKGKTEDIRIIGKKLNVATVLDGSVRRQDNRARITVQLLKTSDGLHLWSDTYDRELTDILAVEADIAHSATAALAGALLAKKTEASPQRRTNPEAYTAFLQGKYFMQRNDGESLEKAAGFYADAVRMDPVYAPAWAGLAVARIIQAGGGYTPVEEGFRKAREAAQRALEVDPELGDGYFARGWILLLYDWDWAGADASFRRALALEPGSVKVISRSASLARALGRLDEAIALARRSTEIDPLSISGWSELGVDLAYAGRNDEAAAAYRKALGLFPERTGIHSLLCLVDLAQSRLWEALAEAKQEKDPLLRAQTLALAYDALGKQEESNAHLKELIGKFAKAAPFTIAEVYSFRGDADQAFRWLETAYTERDSGITDLKGDPLLKNLVHDPRYAALLGKLRLPL